MADQQPTDEDSCSTLKAKKQQHLSDGVESIRCDKKFKKKNKHVFTTISSLFRRNVREKVSRPIHQTINEDSNGESDKADHHSPYLSIVNDKQLFTLDTKNNYGENLFCFPPFSSPGLIGLKNHGNTCFMNAVIQCLSANDVFAKYFITDEYKRDFHRAKKNSCKFGTKGELPNQLALLLKGMWFYHYSPQLTESLKITIEKYSKHYRGGNQQDAQEFLIWLLDKVHEDLNCALKKKYKQNKKTSGKPDNVLAEQALTYHLQHNNSFIHGLFQAQYKSSVQCPDCGHQSVTFDPFLCLSLPLPQNSTRFFSLVVVFLNRMPQMTKIGLNLEDSMTIADLREAVAKLCRIAVTHIVLTEIYFDGFHRSFIDDQLLCTVHDGDPVYAIETPMNFNKIPTPSSMAPFLHVHCNGLVQDIVVLILLNKDKLGSEGLRFGKPVVIEVPRQLTYMQLKSLILKGLGYKQADFASEMDSIFKLSIISGAGGRSYLSPEDMQPLYSAAVDRLIQTSGEEGGPSHIKMLVEWEIDIENCFFSILLDDFIAEDKSLHQERELQQLQSSASLFECFDLYTKEEQLDTEDSWLCPHCKKLKNGPTKRLSLWSTPDVLILHLKRFKQDGLQRTKMNTFVDFPLNDLNLSPHLERNEPSSSSSLQSNWSHCRKYKHQCSNNNEKLYNLFGVCNHIGNLTGGHYTAFCKNPITHQWYLFDDMKVELINEQDIITQGAYLLFYQRKSMEITDD